MLNRRSALIVAAALLSATGVAIAAPASPPAPAAAPSDDMSLGNPKAKIQVTEYASLSCPHCGHFNETVFPTLKAKYIDTGKVHYTLKEMLTQPMQVAAAGFMMARCAGPSKYFTVVDQVFRSQPRWTSGNIKPILQEIGAANGLDDAKFTACLSDQAAFDAVNARAQRAAEQDGVNSTPTLIINGKKIDAVPQTPEELDAVIAAATKGGR
jgi:protein-disulfide isomerase